MGYIYIAGCILFTVYGQLVLKWRMNLKGQLPEALNEKALFMVKLFLDPWLVSGFAAAFIASLFWMAAMTKFEISFAYPFMSASFILVFLLSMFLFGETFTWGKVIGLLLITAGIFVTVKL
ncbi:EamA family transporter [Geofilum rhodophaeum]|uniref:EamA family transporter n=1 Tax=Geofilum rhodophaeum TaxID=1965019 RepID=UPI000B525BE0|nr:EamA family transporter [Geofilum rhodophaeum]